MIGKIIRKLCTEKNITQNELANFLGLTPKMISFYELLYINLIGLTDKPVNLNLKK